MTKLTYIGESSLSLIKGKQYVVLNKLEDNLINVIDESGTDYVFYLNNNLWLIDDIKNQIIETKQIDQVECLSFFDVGYNIKNKGIKIGPVHKLISKTILEVAATSDTAFYKNDIFIPKSIPLFGMDGKWVITGGTYIRKVKVIASSNNHRKIDELARLVNLYKHQNDIDTNPDDWEKVTGQAIVKNVSTSIKGIADVHWYSCINIGKVDMKIKKLIRELPKR
ncbi:hypothetical protein A8F94_20065 [Bacillus sp. FJAT-27225]|uniref:hypothetical protein n=1 Tax=Bacillus sp. FJAT-27225 TaxID=1743144 RepID=UPI00080C344F|nr:hypothetical protein [Bacillus sp. FJAT-27225]OCA82212.1 hypothetical protein A8F94_20065 [Bacillus sp. FJAT-27225]